MTASVTVSVNVSQSMCSRHVVAVMCDFVCTCVQGTFLIRPSISLTGCMVISIISVCVNVCDRVCACVQGTFLIRPSISLTGCMVVSTVTESGAVKHLCLDSKQLYARSLEVMLTPASCSAKLCHAYGCVLLSVWKDRLQSSTLGQLTAVHKTPECGEHAYSILALSTSYLAYICDAVHAH